MKRIGPLVNGAWWLIITVIIMVSFFFSAVPEKLFSSCRSMWKGKKGQGECLHTLIWNGGGGEGEFHAHDVRATCFVMCVISTNRIKDTENDNELNERKRLAK